MPEKYFHITPEFLKAEIARQNEVERQLIFGADPIPPQDHTELNQAKAQALPCPVCGSTDLHIQFNESYGHGDSGYSDLRLQCARCSTSIGRAFGYGSPGDDDIIQAYRIWNDTILGISYIQ
jgi:hypothetical protein